MFKICVLATILALAMAAPAPEPIAKPEPKADPSLIAAAYTTPLVAAPAVAAPIAYTAAYSGLPFASYVAPSVYSAGYTAYAPYASYVVV